MKKLKIIDFGKNHLGTIIQGEGGQLSLEVAQEEYRSELQAFVQRITTQPVHLRTGVRTEEDGKVVERTSRKVVSPGDDDFLLGVQELLNKTRFGEARVRGLPLREKGC